MANLAVRPVRKNNALFAPNAAGKCNTFPDTFFCKLHFAVLQCTCVKLLKEVFLTEFVIYGVLDENKNLVLQGTPTCNQGENQTTKLSVTVPSQMAEGVDFYFEFLCPHHLWVSPKAQTTAEGDTVVVDYLLGGHILSDEGQVMVQIVARSVADQTIVYKSALSAESSICVEKSVNAQTSGKAEDYFGSIANIISQFEGSNFVTTEMLTPLLPTKVGQLENDAGFITSDYVNNNEIIFRVDQKNISSFRLNQDTSKFINLPINDSTISIYQGSTKVGSFTLNQTSDATITLPESSGGGGTVNDATITIYQGGYERGKFTLNQGKNTSIYLDGMVFPSSHCGTEWLSHGEYITIDDTSNCIIDIIVSPDPEYYIEHDDGSFDCRVDEVVINGKTISLGADKRYHTLMLSPQNIDVCWAISMDGVVVDYAPYLSPEEGYNCLCIGINTDNGEGGGYVHFSVR